jgi:hypothetical protein
MQADFEFRVTLDAEERVDLQTVRATLQDVEALLKAIESGLTGQPSKAHWRWGDAAVDLGFVASVNGVSAAQLEEVIETAREGFERASHTPSDTMHVEWPEAFTHEARRRATSILRRLAKLESITIAAAETDPLTIREANIGEVVKARPSRRRVFSSVEGTLRIIAGAETTILARVKERGTGVSVRVSLDAKEWHEKVRVLWDQPVLVEGRVAYADDGRPLSVVDVTAIDPRPSGRPLREFEGAAPGITGTDSTDEFLERARGE